MVGRTTVVRSESMLSCMIRLVESPQAKKVPIQRTLPQGKPELVVFEALDGKHRTLLALSAAMQFRREHPLARAVLAAAEREGIEVSAAAQLHTVAARTAPGQQPVCLRLLGAHACRKITDLSSARRRRVRISFLKCLHGR